MGIRKSFGTLAIGLCAVFNASCSSASSPSLGGGSSSAGEGASSGTTSFRSESSSSSSTSASAPEISSDGSPDWETLSLEGCGEIYQVAGTPMMSYPIVLSDLASFEEIEPVVSESAVERVSSSGFFDSNFLAVVQLSHNSGEGQAGISVTSATPGGAGDIDLVISLTRFEDECLEHSMIVVKAKKSAFPDVSYVSFRVYDLLTSTYVDGSKWGY